MDFTAKLAREHGWDRDYARRAVEEYRRFCFLACACGRMVTPSDAADEVWHLHLTYSRDYWERFCPEVLRAPLHHEPTRGGAAEGRTHRLQYAQTLAAYEHFFGAPPIDLWPASNEQFRRPARFRRVDLERVYVLPRPRLPRVRTAVAAVASLLALIGPALAVAASDNPLDWLGADFLKLYLGLLILAFAASLYWRRQLRNTGEARSVGNLGTYEIAYLGGGAERVVDAGVAEFLASNRAHWDGSSGKLVFDGDMSGLGHPLDKLAQHVRADGNPRSLIKRVGVTLEPLRNTLRARGLLLDEAAVHRLQRLSALPLAALTLFGIAKIAVGISRGKPIGFLFVLTLISAIAALVLLFKRTERTRAGDAAIAQLKESHARASRAPLPGEIPLAVALVGTGVLAGTAYAAYHEARAPSSSSDTSSSGSCSSSSDSGGGGDGGGGGGCGGCGGGGGD